MEDELIEYIRKPIKKSKRVTSWIIRRKSLKRKPDFCNYGKDHERMKNWFYHGFKKRKSLSWTKIAGASRNFPNGWETKVEHIIACVANVQRSQQKHNIIVSPVKYDNMCNTDHVPVYIDKVSSCQS